MTRVLEIPMQLQEKNKPINMTVSGNASATVTLGETTRIANRVVISHTKAEWAELHSLMSKKDIIYVYTDYRQEENPETHEIINIPRIKIGDGMTYVADLPFATMSITDDDIARWNNKSNLQVMVDEETNSLVFYTNE